MDKNQFAKYIAENMNISKQHADIVIEVFTSNLTGALFEGHSVGIDGFGAFIPAIKIKKSEKYSKIPDVAFVASTSLKHIA